MVETIEHKVIKERETRTEMIIKSVINSTNQQKSSMHMPVDRHTLDILWVPISMWQLGSSAFYWVQYSNIPDFTKGVYDTEHLISSLREWNSIFILFSSLSCFIHPFFNLSLLYWSCSSFFGTSELWNWNATVFRILELF